MFSTAHKRSLQFDFEDEEDIMNEENLASLSTEQRRRMQEDQSNNEEFDRRIGTVVCKHWLRSLCKKSDKCEFLHRFDPKKMRECDNRTTEECGQPRCPFRHVDVSEDTENESCVPYDLGFCPDGPHCTSRHQKRHPWERPKIGDWKAKPKMAIKRQEERAVTKAPNQQFKTAMCAKYNGGKGFCRFGAECHFAHSENELRKHRKAKGSDTAGDDTMANLQAVDLRLTTELLRIPYSPYKQLKSQGGGAEKIEDGSDPSSLKSELPASLDTSAPAPAQELPTRYFFLRCPTFKMLAVAADCGVVLASVENIPAINEAYDSGAPVVLLFSVFRSDSYQGIAKLESPLGDESALTHWIVQCGALDSDRMAAMRVTWLHITDVRFAKVTHLRKRLSWDMRLTKLSKCHELPPRFAHALVVYAYLQPVTDLVQIEDGGAAIVDNTKDPPPTVGRPNQRDHLFTKLLQSMPVTGVNGVTVACDRQLFDEFMRHQVCALPFEQRAIGNNLRTGSLLFFIDAAKDQLIGVFEILGKPMPRILPYGLLDRSMGLYTEEDLRGGDELQIRFHPLLLCPNLHQALIAKAICEYVPEALRSDTCDNVVREMAEREVSTTVNLLARKYGESPTRNVDRDLKAHVIVGPQFTTLFRERAQAELGEQYQKLVLGCASAKVQLCGIGSGFCDFRTPDGSMIETQVPIQFHVSARTVSDFLTCQQRTRRYVNAAWAAANIPDLPPRPPPVDPNFVPSTPNRPPTGGGGPDAWRGQGGGRSGPSFHGGGGRGGGRGGWQGGGRGRGGWNRNAGGWGGGDRKRSRPGY